MVNGYTQLHATVNENHITYYVNTSFLVNNFICSRLLFGFHCKHNNAKTVVRKTDYCSSRHQC